MRAGGLGGTRTAPAKPSWMWWDEAVAAGAEQQWVNPGTLAKLKTSVTPPPVLAVAEIPSPLGLEGAGAEADAAPGPTHVASNPDPARVADSVSASVPHPVPGFCRHRFGHGRPRQCRGFAALCRRFRRQRGGLCRAMCRFLEPQDRASQRRFGVSGCVPAESQMRPNICVPSCALAAS